MTVFFGKKTVLPHDAPPYLQDFLAELEDLQRAVRLLATGGQVRRYVKAGLPSPAGVEAVALVTDGPDGLTLAGSDGVGWFWLTGTSAGSAVT